MGFFPEKKLIFGSKIRNSRQQIFQKFHLLKPQPFSIGFQPIQDTIKRWQQRGWALRQPLCLNPCTIIGMISAFLLPWMRAELQRCNLQGVCDTFLLLLALTRARAQRTCGRACPHAQTHTYTRIYTHTNWNIHYFFSCVSVTLCLRIQFDVENW